MSPYAKIIGGMLRWEVQTQRPAPAIYFVPEDSWSLHVGSLPLKVGDQFEFF